MRRLAPGLGLLLAAAACGVTTPEPVQLRLAPTNVRGQSIVGRLASIELDVFADDTGVTCNETGGANGLDASPAPATLTQATLGSTGCPAGARFCGQVELERADAPRIFVARGLDADGGLFARACASVLLDRAEVDVDLVFQRALAPATCGNGTLEAPETCEGPGTGTCNAACVSQDLVLSTGSSGNDTIDGEGTRKLAPTLVSTATALTVLYTDDTSASDDGDIAVRSTSPTLEAQAGALGASFFLAEGAPPNPTTPGAQTGAVSCATNGPLFVAYETAGVGTDIALRSLDASFAGGTELLLSGDASTTGGTAGDQRYAAIACSDSAGFSVWRDVTSGRVLGRRITAPSSLGRIQEIGGASDGTRITIARRTAGWIAAWEAGRQIRYRVLGEDGTPSGGEIVLEGDAIRSHPALTALADGRVALAYAEGDEGARIVHVQRFDADGRRVGEAVAVSEAGADAPALVGMNNVAEGAYAVVWVTAGRVQARYLGGNSGFLLNPLSSTEDAFFADAREGRSAATPTVAITAAALAIAWQDVADDGGIVARLLPLPTR